MSPTLHYHVYGFQPETDFNTTMRMGGWRPQVFMQHGLAVGLFMSIAWIAAVGLWLWSGVRTVMSLSIVLCCIALFGGSVLCRSAYALMLMIVAGGLLTAVYYSRYRRLAILLGLVPILYMGIRTLGGWDASELVDLSARLFGNDRASSLMVRLRSETNLWGLAQQKPMFGYGHWVWSGRTPSGEPMIPDGMWIIALGRYGLVGLCGVTLMFLLPGWLIVRRLRRSELRTPGAGVWVTLTIIPSIYAMDNLLNAMLNPLFMLAAGAVSGGVATLGRRPRVGREHPTAAPHRNREWNSAPS
jgi:O-antigen ligase